MAPVAMTSGLRSTPVLPWAIAATPVLPVVVLFTWHPRTWLESAASSGIDIAFVGVIAAVVVSVALAVVLARVDSRRSRGERTDQPSRWRRALLGAPVYLAGRAAAGERGYRLAALVSAAVALLGVIVVVQKVVDAAPLLG